MQFIKQTLYSLTQQYGTTIELFKTIVGTPDFENGLTAVSKQSVIVPAIALPNDLAKTMFKSSIITYDKNMRRFIIDINGFSESWIVDATHIIYLNKRYNIKEFSKLEDHYFDVVATSAGDEPHE